jgi:hypothetical protein
MPLVNAVIAEVGTVSNFSDFRTYRTQPHVVVFCGSETLL